MEKIEIVKDKDLSALEEKGKLTLQENGLEQSQILHILQKTPINHIYKRPARGGGEWDYVTGVYIKKVLNYVFGWNWDFEIINEQEQHGQVVVKGKLTVKDIKGNSITKMQFGRAFVKYKKDTTDALDYGNDLKAASTDALKKCASELGIASDIYGKNEFKEVKSTPDGLPMLDFNKALDSYLQEEKLLASDFDTMSVGQQAVIQELKKSFKRLKSRSK